jgi:3-dehydroquinate synthetase
MNAASYIAERRNMLHSSDAAEMRRVTNLYGPIPHRNGLNAESIARHIFKDKKTIQGQTHFVLAEAIGRVKVVSGITAAEAAAAAAAAL